MTFISRREMLIGTLMATPALLHATALAEDRDQTLQQGVAELERKHGGRLGVAVLNTAMTKPAAHRGDERFPLCSTHKVLSTAFILSRVDHGKENLNRRIVYGKESLVEYSPVTSKHVGGDGLTLSEVCAAAMLYSDNTAANLMLDSFGGPAALTAYLRSLGDTVTRLDGHEPELNAFTPGDPRNTTTPLAIAATMHKISLGDALSPSSRRQINEWLVACKTGVARLRAGAPVGWRIGDRTGTGTAPQNATNDLAVMWPAGRPPLVVTAFYIDSREPADARNAVLARVGRLATAG